MCQRKYALDLIEEHGLFGKKKPTSTPVNYNHKIITATDKDIMYRQLVGNLLYLTFTRLDIMYGV